MRARLPVLVSLAAAGVAGAFVAARPGTAAPGDTIGVVSMLTVIMDAPQKDAIEKRQKDRENQAKTFAQGEEARLKALHAEIQALPRAHPQRRQKEDDYVRAEAKIEADLKILKARALDEYTSEYETLHQSVKQVVTDVARARGLKLVLFKTDDPINLRSPGEFAVNVGMRTVVWADGSLDITEAVKEQVRSRIPGGAPPAGGTPPPPPPPGPAPVPPVGPAMDGR
jgi:Skp family chaperone for outer membrane proteins